MDICKAARSSLRASRSALRCPNTHVRNFRSTSLRHQETASQSVDTASPSSQGRVAPGFRLASLLDSIEPTRPDHTSTYGSFAPRRSIPTDPGRPSSRFDALGLENTKASDYLQQPSEPVVKPLLKLGPNVGRSFHVDAGRGLDVARAFRNLDTACKRNKVRTDFLKQRFHERPGLKRKRIRYEGKIRGFKARFTKVVQMVQSMTKSGW